VNDIRLGHLGALERSGFLLTDGAIGTGPEHRLSVPLDPEILKVLGGCGGTDDRHIDALGRRLMVGGR